MTAKFATHCPAICSLSTALMMVLMVNTAKGQCPGLGSITFNVVAAPVPTLNFPTGICSGQQSIITVNEPFDTYLWSTGGTSNSITVTQGGTYTVTVTNVTGCEASATAIIVANPNPQPTITGNTTICPGASTLLSLGQNYPDILWSSGQTTQQITVSSIGTYSVTVTDANGCTASNSIGVTAAPPLTPPFSAQSTGCGQFTLEVGPGYVSYLWSTGSMTQSILVTQNGPYSVTVSDAGGCTGSVSTTVVIPPPSLVQITGGQSICTGGTTTLTASTGFVSYAWSNGVSTSTNTVSQSGIYTVTATDNTGCTSTATTTVASLPDPVPTLNQPAPICAGETATISVTNPIFQNYSWSNGGTGSFITVSSAGTYTVTVTDAAGCTGTTTTSLTVNQTPVVSASQLPYQCNGLAELTATPGFPSYAWSNSQSTPNITVGQPGSYTVTVTGVNGCTSAASVGANIPPAPQVSISGAPVICGGTNAVLSATPGFANYIWSTGQGGPSISVNSTGTYFVTVTDNLSCTGTALFNVSVQPSPQAQITGPTQICAGGTAVFTATGGPFASYIWSNGSQVPTISVSAPGSYGLTVTNASGCTGTASVALAVGNSLNIALTELPYQCNGEITFDAGAGFQGYAWSNGGSTQFEVFSTNGNFTVTVTDATGCSGSATATVNIPALPQASISGTNQICEGESAVLTATAGFANYLWSNGQQNPSINATATGTYAVTVTDFDGCQATASFSLAVNPGLQPIITGASTICQNSSTVLSAPGNYQAWTWSTGQMTPQITASSAGSYAVTVTDANGCTGTDVFQLTVNSNLQPQIAAQPYACNGQLTLDAGAVFQTYIWSNGGASQTVVVSQNGNYEVTVSDASGCTGTAVFSANIPAQQQVAIAGVTSFCTGGSSLLTASAGFQNYLWSNGAAVAEITVTQPGTYTVTATEANGCTSVDAISVTAVNLPTPQVLGSATICNGSSTVLSLSQTYPNILWSTGETAQQIAASMAGIYSVTVSNANGCTGTVSATVTTASSLSPQIAALPVTCGQISLDAGSGFASYLWSDGSSSQSILVSQNGNYAVTVSDAGGCTGTDLITVTLPTPVPVAITGDQTICTGGAATLTATAGFLVYAWSNGATMQQTTVTQPGQYSVTATDLNGCNAVAELTIIEDFILPPQLLGSSIICNGNPTTLGLSASYDNYLWSNGSTNPTITVATPGLVSVTVTNTNGCLDETSIDVMAGNNLNPQVVQLSQDCSGLVGLGVGNAYETYLWNNGGTNQITLVDQTGTYFVTVTDANGCSGVGSIFAQVPQQFSVSISGNTAFCPGGSSVLTATDGFQDYAWSNGAVGAEITVSQAGNYTVTVSDINGCTGTAQVAVTVGSGTPLQIIGNSVICVGGSTVLSIANASNFAQFLWSNGLTAPQITATAAGVYTVTATDLSGCTATVNIEVTVGNSLAPSISESGYNCDGNLTLEAPDGFQSYNWSNGADAPTITISQDGSYALTVTDASGCTGTASIFVQVPDEVVVVVQTPPTPICPGDTAQLSVPPGFADYAWSTGETTNAIVIVSSGNYVVTVTDQYGCTASDDYQFNFAEAPDFDIIGDQLDCESVEAVLELDLVEVNGAPSFLWSNGATTAALVTVQPGIFSVTVTDGNGCTAAQVTEVLQADIFTSSFADTIEFVPGQVVSLVPPGVGFLPVEITWSPTDILLDCTNCPTAQARPIEDVLVTYTAVSAAGCEQEGTFFLFFKNRVRPSVYAPNAFSPDSPYNPGFTLFGNELVAEIKYLRIFTRWGEMVAELKNLALNDPSKGWDGSFRGEMVDPGVFVWVAEVVYSDGSTEVLKGDVTVVR